MDPQQTDPSQDNRQAKGSSRGIRAPNILGWPFGRTRRRILIRTGLAAGRTILTFFLGTGGPVIIALAVISLFTLLIVLFVIPPVGIPSTSAPPTPTPTPTGPPPPTPTPTPPGPCGVGKAEKTVTVGQSASSLSIHYSERNWQSSCGLGSSGWGYSSGPHSNSPIRYNKSAASACQFFPIFANRLDTDFAIVNFSGLSLPQNTTITSAALSSPTSGSGCEAGILSGRIGTTTVGPSYSGSGLWFNSSPPSEPSWTSGGTFGASNITTFNTGGCCSGVCKPNIIVNATCVSSGLTNGTGNVTSLMQGFVNSQSITNVSFKIEPKGVSFACDIVQTVLAGNFQLGPAALTINYCE